MINREEAKQKAILLKRLREAHQETVARTQALLKEQKGVRKKICQTMREQPKAIPEIAEQSGVAAHEVLWHVMAMKKYDLVVEAGICGEYYLYQMAEKKRK
jgi:predicted transcriptional regulator